MGPGQSLMHLASDAVRAAAESPFLEEAVRKASAILCCISMPSPKQRFAGEPCHLLNGRNILKKQNARFCLSAIITQGGSPELLHVCPLCQLCIIALLARKLSRQFCALRDIAVPAVGTSLKCLVMGTFVAVQMFIQLPLCKAPVQSHVEL